MIKTMGRRPIPVPKALLSAGLQLVQVFRKGEPAAAVPVDQILLRPGETPAALMLSAGSFWARAVDENGAVSKPVTFDLQ